MNSINKIFLVIFLIASFTKAFPEVEQNLKALQEKLRMLSGMLSEPTAASEVEQQVIALFLKNVQDFQKSAEQFYMAYKNVLVNFNYPEQLEQTKIYKAPLDALPDAILINHLIKSMEAFEGIKFTDQNASVIAENCALLFYLAQVVQGTLERLTDLFKQTTLEVSYGGKEGQMVSDLYTEKSRSFSKQIELLHDAIQATIKGQEGEFKQAAVSQFFSEKSLEQITINPEAENLKTNFKGYWKRVHELRKNIEECQKIIMHLAQLSQKFIELSQGQPTSEEEYAQQQELEKKVTQDILIDSQVLEKLLPKEGNYSPSYFRVLLPEFPKFAAQKNITLQDCDAALDLLITLQEMFTNFYGALDAFNTNGIVQNVLLKFKQHENIQFPISNFTTEVKRLIAADEKVEQKEGYISHAMGPWDAKKKALLSKQKQ